MEALSGDTAALLSASTYTWERFDAQGARSSQYGSPRSNVRSPEETESASRRRSALTYAYVR